MSFQEYMEKVRQTIKPSDMPNDDLEHIAETCGIEVALKLIEHCNGATNICVPLSSFKKFERAYIQEEYAKEPRQKTILRLANEMKITRTEISKIVGQDIGDSSIQLGLLDQ
ncbi:MAG: hypothetical protein AB1706_10260 [Pseudomonadota bacterium]